VCAAQIVAFDNVALDLVSDPLSENHAFLTHYTRIRTLFPTTIIYVAVEGNLNQNTPARFETLVQDADLEAARTAYAPLLGRTEFIRGYERKPGIVGVETTAKFKYDAFREVNIALADGSLNMAARIEVPNAERIPNHDGKRDTIERVFMQQLLRIEADPLFSALLRRVSGVPRVSGKKGREQDDMVMALLIGYTWLRMIVKQSVYAR